MSAFIVNRALTARDVDRDGFLLPSELLEVMQEAGAAHCDALNVGMMALRERNLAWVITRAAISMRRYPRVGEALTIRTCPNKTRLSLFPRDFAFSVGEEDIGFASTLYVLLDLSMRAAAKPGALGAPIDIDESHKPLPYPGNIAALDAEPIAAAYRPVYTDFDVNGHVNNTRYLRWFLDQYPPERHREEQLSYLLVHFNHEILPGQDVVFERREREGVSVFSCLVGGVNCFSAQGTWTKRETA